MTLNEKVSPQLRVAPFMSGQCKILLRRTAIVVLPCAAILAWCTEVLEARPSLVVSDGKIYQAGKVRVGSPLIHKFRLFNPHAYSVGIETHREGCDCSNIVVQNPLIGPKSSTTVEVSTQVAGNGEHTEAFRLIFKHSDKIVEDWLLVQYTATPQ